MKTTTFNYVIGEQAYAIWYVYNDFEIDMGILTTVEQNLELIMSSEGDVYAYRSNLPLKIGRLFKRSGAWEFTEDTDLLNDNDLFRLKLICRNFAFN